MKPTPMKFTYPSQLQAALPQVEIEDEPYDYGYWLRVAGDRCPGLWDTSWTRGHPYISGDMRRGWEDADQELKNEGLDIRGEA